MVRSSENVLKLIDNIYEAALDPSVLPTMLGKVADMVGGTQLMMGVHAFSGQRPSAIMPRMDPELLDAYHRHWAQHDIQWLSTNSAPVGKILPADVSVPHDEFARTAIYNEWYRQAGIGVAGLGVNLYVKDGVPVVCGIRRSTRDGDFSLDDVRMFEILAPHLARAIKLHHCLRQERLAAEAASARARWDCDGVVLVDKESRILHLDPDANRIIDARDGLRVEQGRLIADDRSVNAALSRIVDRHGRENFEPRAPRPLLIARGKGRAPLQIEAMPYRAKQPEMVFGVMNTEMPAAIVIITDPERSHSLPKECLRTRFGLTPAEADLALEIAKGDGRIAAAARLGISVGTVRTHIARIFEKTGVRRQAELVRIVLKYANR
jgi:DNA-binding CsgD family transcriptional regulator